MNYIVFDLEWNQCPYGKEREIQELPFEIIEIGAVKLNEKREVVDTFQQLVRPAVYRKLHFRTKEIIAMSEQELKNGIGFSSAVREFLNWCGEDYKFCTWGSVDLTELQRNMKYYGVLKLLSGPVYYYDIQKLFSLQYEDGKSRKSLEYAIDFLQMQKKQEFHRAISDAEYTAQIFQTLQEDLIKTYESIDCYQNPKNKKEEIYIRYPGYMKYISREFNTKEEVMKDREVISSRCLDCGKTAKKKIRWFAVSPKNQECIAFCPVHGYLKGKIRIKKTDEGKVFAVKILKTADIEQMQELKEKKEHIRKKRRKKNGVVK